MKLRIVAVATVLLSILLATQWQVNGSVSAQRVSSPLHAAPSPVLTMDQGPVPQMAPTRPPPLKPPSQRTGFIPPPMDLSHLKGDRMPDGVTAQSLPARWDWRERGVVTSVEDQGACGSCYAFATIANFESRLLIDGAGTLDFSENNAKECNWEARNGYLDPYGDPVGSCAGGTFQMVANLLSQTGTVMESCDPYVPTPVPCATSCPYQKTVLDWGCINGNVVPDTDVLKSYIMTYGPVYTSMYASFDGFDRYYDGSYTLYYPGTEDPDHAVLIVGWDDSLPHAGGTGGWIVKNSWGTDWGGTCGYGSESGYFTIAYGSANIGYDSRFFREWQDYDPTGDLLYYDDAGWTTSWGYGSTTGWGLCKFIPDKNTSLTRIEFWTTDATTDVDLYIYDSFDGMSVTNLLYSRLDLSYGEAGYHSVPVDPPLPLANGNDVVAVVKFTNSSYLYPIPTDNRGPAERGRTYISHSGSDGSWYDMGAGRDRDVAIRLRTSDTIATPTATRTATATGAPTATPTRTATTVFTPTATPTPTETQPGDLVLTGLVYNAAIDPPPPIPRAVVSVIMCTGRPFQAMTGLDGRYSLLLPAEQLNACAYVTLQAWAVGYYSFSEIVAVSDLRADPLRDIGLHPIGWPTPAHTPTSTRTRTPWPTRHDIFLPIVLRGYPPPPPTPTPTPTPTVTPTPQQVQLIVNPSFETDQAWVILKTAHPASYSFFRAHSGWRSMRLGLASGTNVFSYSSVQQTVEIPAGATHAELSFYYFPLMGWAEGGRIYFCVLRASDDRILQCDYWTEATQAWHLRRYDLSSYAGQRIKVHFGVKNDGLDGITAVYLDDVELWVRW